MEEVLLERTPGSRVHNPAHLPAVIQPTPTAMAEKCDISGHHAHPWKELRSSQVPLTWPEQVATQPPPHPRLSAVESSAVSAVPPFGWLQIAEAGLIVVSSYQYAAPGS